MSTAALDSQATRFDVLVSVLVVLQDDAAILPAFLAELHAELESKFHYFEVLLVDLSSRDETCEVVIQQMQKLSHLRLLRLSAP